MTNGVIASSTTAQEDAQKNWALQEKLPSDTLIWGLPIRHPAEIPTGRSPLSLCRQKKHMDSLVVIEFSWKSEYISLVSREFTLYACICLCTILYELVVTLKTGTKHVSVADSIYIYICIHSHANHKGWFTSINWYYHMIKRLMFITLHFAMDMKWNAAIISERYTVRHTRTHTSVSVDFSHTNTHTNRSRW